MAIEIVTLNLDLINDRASITMFEKGVAKTPVVSVEVNIATPGNQHEFHMKKAAITEAKKALQSALDLLDKSQLT
ncbi:hypothetical protein GAY28_11020 [Azospirillum brasilense]|nr:hypothetical protein [Azospirillum brasilense]